MAKYDPITGTRIQRLLFVSLIPGPAKRHAANVLGFLVIFGLAVLAMFVL